MGTEVDDTRTNGLVFVDMLSEPFIFCKFLSINVTDISLGFGLTGLECDQLRLFHDTMNIEHTTARLASLHVCFLSCRSNHTATPIEQLLEEHVAISFSWKAEVSTALASHSRSRAGLSRHGLVVFSSEESVQGAFEERKLTCLSSSNNRVTATVLHEVDFLSKLTSSHLLCHFWRDVVSLGKGTSTGFDLQGVECLIDFHTSTVSDVLGHLNHGIVLFFNSLLASDVSHRIFTCDIFKDNVHHVLSFWEFQSFSDQ